MTEEEAQAESFSQEEPLLSGDMQDIADRINDICENNDRDSTEEEGADSGPEPKQDQDNEQENNTEEEDNPQIADTQTEQNNEEECDGEEDLEHQEPDVENESKLVTSTVNDATIEEPQEANPIMVEVEGSGSVEEEETLEHHEQNNENNDQNDTPAEEASTVIVFEAEEGGLPLADASEEEEEEECVSLCAHQPTFVNLGNLIPRGFNSMADLPTFKENNDVIPSESTLQMQQDKWKEIGYDPNHGKGSMKPSFTMQNIKGYGMKTVTAHKEVSKFDRLQEMDAESPLKLPKPGGGRVNSSEGPRVQTVMEEEEEHEHDGFSEGSDEHEGFSEEEEEPFTIGGIAELLGSVPMVEEGPTVEEEKPVTESTEKKQLLKAKLPKPNRRTETVAVKKPYRFQNEQPSFLERNNMFLTQVEEEVKLVKAGKSGKKSDTTQKVFNDAKCQEIENTYGTVVSKTKDGSKKSKPKIVQPVVTYHKRKRVDLSAYDDPEFDADTESKKIPPRLLPMITHSSENLVFRALCQESMLDYPKKAVGQVISDLKVYLNTCVKKNMIGEGSYVECIIANIKMEMAEQSRTVNCESKKVAEKIEHVESQYSRRIVEWKKQKNILEVERDLAIQDLELKFEEDSANLEDEWNSEKIQARYNKPSAKLISMRQHAKALINAHLFEDASVLASMISKQEREEVSEAAVRMNREYRAAHERLKDKFESDKGALDEAFNTKRNGLLSAESQDLRPLESRIESLKKLKTNTEISEKRNAIVSSGIKKKVPVSTNMAPITLNSKLKLPPLKALGRRSASSSAKKSLGSNKQPSLGQEDMPVVTDTVC